jgi:t-SNARE complex subunit (syntaxin)
MGGDDEKESLFGDLNTAFESQWPCSVGITFWEKTIGWSLSKARWPTKVELHPIVVVVVVVGVVVVAVVVVVVVGGRRWVAMTRRRT